MDERPKELYRKMSSSWVSPNQREVLRIVLAAGARLADRAIQSPSFLNDKIDLAQAEGLLDVIEAESRGTAGST